MTINRGKQWEQKFKQDWLKSMPDSTIDRLYDVTTGYKAISQVSDFIGYKQPLIFYLECKEHLGASMPLNNITQYDKLLVKVGIPGVRAGVVLWLSEKDTVVYIPISTVQQMKNAGEKSVGIRNIDNYNIYKIPATKKRVFMDCDFSILMNTVDGE